MKALAVRRERHLVVEAGELNEEDTLPLVSYAYYSS